MVVFINTETHCTYDRLYCKLNLCWVKTCNSGNKLEDGLRYYVVDKINWTFGIMFLSFYNISVENLSGLFLHSVDTEEVQNNFSYITERNLVFILLR